MHSKVSGGYQFGVDSVHGPAVAQTAQEWGFGVIVWATVTLCKALGGAARPHRCALSLYYQLLLVAQQLTRSGAGLAGSTEPLVHFVLSTMLVTVVAQTLGLMVVFCRLF